MDIFILSFGLPVGLFTVLGSNLSVLFALSCSLAFVSGFDIKKVHSANKFLGVFSRYDRNACELAAKQYSVFVAFMTAFISVMAIALFSLMAMVFSG